jgi:hypothetical protein
VGAFLFGVVLGVVIGSFFPQPEFFKKIYDTVKSKFTKE